MYAYLMQSKHSFVESFMSFPLMDMAATSTKCFSRFNSINGEKVLNGCNPKGPSYLYSLRKQVPCCV
ncbi:hypothetical protein NC651_007587 [Populus alba x Populus x berolinensis]|nr:hypothetical protein NC651_007587 [Populus alba x Populus x berolinensis]